MIEIILLVIWLGAITIAITIHEYAHAWAADRLGDPTARLQGRLSLNPLKHYDPIGTTMLIVTAAMRAFGAPVIPLGWAKPVPFDPYNLQNVKRDSALIALAGPAINIIFAIITSAIFHLFFSEIPILSTVTVALITINIALAIFNLIPIHPLDGGKIIAGILPDDMAREFNMVVGRFGILILIFLIMPWGGTSPIGALIIPIIQALLNLLL